MEEQNQPQKKAEENKGQIKEQIKLQNKGNYVIQVSGEIIPRMVFLNETPEYVSEVVKFMTATSSFMAVPTRYIKYKNPARLVVKNPLHGTKLEVKAVSEETARKLINSLIGNSASAPVIMNQQQQLQKQIQQVHIAIPVKMQNPAKINSVNLSVKPVQRIPTKKIVELAIQRVQEHIRSQMNMGPIIKKQYPSEINPNNKFESQKIAQIAFNKFNQPNVNANNHNNKNPQKQMPNNFQKPQVKPNNQNLQDQQNQQKARMPVSIQDEIRRMIQSELAKQKK